MKSRQILQTAVLGLIMSLFSVPCLGQTLVQHAHVDSGKQTNKKQLKLTFPKATTPGDLLVVMAGWDSGIIFPGFPQLFDNINGDYTPIEISSTEIANEATSFMAYLANCEGGTPTVTIKLPTQQNNIQLDIVEIRGASSLDKDIAGNAITGGSANGNNGNCVPGSFLNVNTGPAIANDIVVGCFSQNIPDAITLISRMPIDVTPVGQFPICFRLLNSTGWHCPYYPWHIVESGFLCRVYYGI